MAYDTTQPRSGFWQVSWTVETPGEDFWHGAGCDKQGTFATEDAARTHAAAVNGTVAHVNGDGTPFVK